MEVVRTGGGPPSLDFGMEGAWMGTKKDRAPSLLEQRV